MNIGCLAELATLFDNTDVNEIDDQDEEIVRYEVYDLMGRLVYSEKTISTNINEIRVTNLESGIYMVRFFTKNGNTVTRKILQ